jgi:hypothetical protein
MSDLFIMSGGGGSGSSAWSALTSPTANLTLSMAGYTTEFDQTSAVTWKWLNTTAATSTTAQPSPIIKLGGQGWKTSSSSSVEIDWTLQNVPNGGGYGAPYLVLACNPTAQYGVNNIGQPTVQLKSDNITPPALSFYGTAGNASPVLSISCNRSDTTGGVNMVTDLNVSFAQRFAILSAAGSTTAAQGPIILLGGNGGNNGRNFASTSGTSVAIDLCGTGLTSGSGTVMWNPSSGAGNMVFTRLQPVVNQTGSASGSYTALQINVTETAVLGTANKLFDAQVGGTSKFHIDNVGAVYLTAASGAPTSAGTAGTAGEIIYYGGNLYFCSVTGAAGSATWNKLSMTSV